MVDLFALTVDIAFDRGIRGACLIRQRLKVIPCIATLVPSCQHRGQRGARKHYGIFDRPVAFIWSDLGVERVIGWIDAFSVCSIALE